MPRLQDQWRRLREMTGRPFAINHTNRPFDEAAFAAEIVRRVLAEAEGALSRARAGR